MGLLAARAALEPRAVGAAVGAAVEAPRRVRVDGLGLRADLGRRRRRPGDRVALLDGRGVELRGLGADALLVEALVVERVPLLRVLGLLGGILRLVLARVRHLGRPPEAAEEAVARARELEGRGLADGVVVPVRRVAHVLEDLQHLLAVPAAGRAARVVAPEERGVVRGALAAVLPAPRRVLGHGVVGDARAVLGRARVLAAEHVGHVVGRVLGLLAGHAEELVEHELVVPGAVEVVEVAQALARRLDELAEPRPRCVQMVKPVRVDVLEVVEAGAVARPEERAVRRVREVVAVAPPAPAQRRAQDLVELLERAAAAHAEPPPRRRHDAHGDADRVDGVEARPRVPQPRGQGLLLPRRELLHELDLGRVAVGVQRKVRLQLAHHPVLGDLELAARQAPAQEVRRLPGLAAGLEGRRVGQEELRQARELVVVVELEEVARRPPRAQVEGAALQLRGAVVGVRVRGQQLRRRPAARLAVPLDPREPLAPRRAVGDDLALRAAHARDLAAELVAAVLQVLVGELRARPPRRRGPRRRLRDGVLQVVVVGLDLLRPLDGHRRREAHDLLARHGCKDSRN